VIMLPSGFECRDMFNLSITHLCGFMFKGEHSHALWHPCLVGRYSGVLFYFFILLGGTETQGERQCWIWIIGFDGGGIMIFVHQCPFTANSFQWALFLGINGLQIFYATTSKYSTTSGQMGYFVIPN
jgi:hypothetical protein